MSFKKFSASQGTPAKNTQDEKTKAGHRSDPEAKPMTGTAAEPSAKPAKVEPAPK